MSADLYAVKVGGVIVAICAAEETARKRAADVGGAVVPYVII